MANTDPFIYDITHRVTRLEQEVTTRGAEHAVMKTELAVMKTDLTYVKDHVGGISKGINRILWAIGLSVIGAICTFVLSGGLTIIPQ